MVARLSRPAPQSTQRRLSYGSGAELDKLELAYPTVLARYAVAQVNDGRKVGRKLNIRDVLSPYCQKRKDVTVERLDKFGTDEGCWQEALIEDRSTGPAERPPVLLERLQRGRER